MLRMTIPAAALLSTMLLASCGGKEVLIEVPEEILVARPKPDLPPPGAPNRQTADYLIAGEEWMDGATDQIGTLAGIVCALTGQTCPGARK